MKFSCTQENLNQGLQVVSHVTGKNISLPILNNVLIKAGSELKLITTNLEIAISCQVRAKIDEGGEFTVPAKLFADYLEVVSPGRSDLNVKDSELVIQTGADRSVIKGNPAADFPVIPELDRQEKFALLAEDFKTAMQQLLVAVSRAEIRPELAGVLFSFNPDGRAGYLICAATDSYRLAEKELKLLADTPNQKYSRASKKIIVPAKTIQEVTRIISSYRSDLDQEAALTIITNENKILFSYGSVELTSRLIDGEYPNYRQIIPSNFKTTAAIQVGELIKRIKAASLFCSSGINGIVADFKAGSDQKIIITSLGGQVGENRSEVLCQINGEDNKILLNYRYLLDGLMNLNAEEAILKINSGEAPCLLTPKDQNDYLYIIMPIKQ